MGTPSTSHPSHSWRRIVAAGFLAVIVVAIGIGVAERSFRDGSPSVAWFGVTMALLGVFLAVAAWTLVLQNRFPHGAPVPRLEDRDGVATTRVPRWPVPMALAATAGGILALWPTAVMVLQARSGSWLVAAVVAVPALYFWSLPWWIVSGRIVPGGIWLTPDAIIHRAGAAYSSVRWDAVSRITFAPGGQHLLVTAAAFDQRFTAPTFRSKLFRRSDAMVVSVELLHPDPVETRMFVETYLHDPALRAELGTQASLERLASLERQAADARSRSGEHGSGS